LPKKRPLGWVTWTAKKDKIYDIIIESIYMYNNSQLLLITLETSIK
jgi:hypothetical protein